MNKEINLKSHKYYSNITGVKFSQKEKRDIKLKLLHKKGDTINKPAKSNKDFTFAAIDFLVVISSVILILIFLFVSFSNLINWDIISAAIFVLLAIFMAMLLKFWMLIQRNNKISVNIKQNKLKNIYKKSGVHLKFDNSKIKIKKKVKKSNKKVK